MLLIDSLYFFFISRLEIVMTNVECRRASLHLLGSYSPTLGEYPKRLYINLYRRRAGVQCGAPTRPLLLELR